MTENCSRRNTRQRATVLRAVRNLACHPTAEQVYDEVRKELPRTSLSTVYRNLSVLVDQGTLASVHGTGKELHYDHKTGDHCHIECSVCGRICDVKKYPLNTEELKRKRISGFILQEVNINLVGICPRCANNTEQESK